MKELFADFLKEKQFLQGVSPKTLRSYQQAFNCYVKLVAGVGLEPTSEAYEASKLANYSIPLPSKEILKTFVIKMRESGLSAGGCNAYIRAINSFLSWLHENGHCEALKIKQLPKPQTVIKVFSEAHIQALVKFKPTNKYEWRLHTLICLLVDTGARIDEGLTCLVSNVDLENLVVKVRGKGNKERLLPFSIELRKILWVYMNRHRFKVGDYLFPTRDGRKLEYHNTLRDLKELCGRLGIEGVRLSPHGFRHYFACHFIRRGGDVYTLSRILGHSSVTVSELYLRSMGIDQISERHLALSPLNQMK